MARQSAGPRAANQGEVVVGRSMLCGNAAPSAPSSRGGAGGAADGISRELALGAAIAPPPKDDDADGGADVTVLGGGTDDAPWGAAPARVAFGPDGTTAACGPEAAAPARAAVGPAPLATGRLGSRQPPIAKRTPRIGAQ